MEITEVRIKLMKDNSGSNERLQAFCSITFDDMFVIRDLKIIEGAKGFFVGMPSRKLTDRCHFCGTKNHLRSRFCNQCGGRLDENRALRDADGHAKLHADIAHPINPACREKIQAAVLAAYADDLERSKLPDYVSSWDAGPNWYDPDEDTQHKTLLSPELHQAIAKIVDARDIPKWLNIPNEMLGGRTPASLLAEGRDDLIWDAIDRVMSGNLS